MFALQRVFHGASRGLCQKSNFRLPVAKLQIVFAYVFRPPDKLSNILQPDEEISKLLTELWLCTCQKKHSFIELVVEYRYVGQ